MTHNLHPTFLVLAISFLLLLPLASAPKKVSHPDFTKGDPIPEGADHDWNLGATGARGWMYSDKLVTTDARQIRITEVKNASPADGALEESDVILGVAGKLFTYDPRTELGKALTVAESEAGGGKLALTRWRGGKTEEVTLTLPVLGSYSATAPYQCPKSKHILEEGCKVLAERIAESSYKTNPIIRSLNALALLASGKPEYIPLVKKEVEWAADYSATSFQTWYYGYVIMLLSEYVMATEDDSVMPGLRRLAMEAASGQSIVGSWGHKFAGSDGRLMGYGMMNAPGLPLTTSLVMARAAGVKNPEVSSAIERSARLLRFYIGKGAVPYGDHHPWIQTHEDNGKCGMAAVLFSLLNEPQGAKFFSRMSIASHGSERDTGHTGNFWNILWSIPGVAQSGPQATGAWMEEYGSWYFDLARRWDNTFLHQGPPNKGRDSYRRWDCTGAYLLAYAMPLREIYLTGKRQPIAPQVNAATAKQLVLDGRGWSNKDRQSAYDGFDQAALFSRLVSWSPVVRERAAMALARHEKVPMKPLLAMLEGSSIETRLGACQALAQLKSKAAPAVPALRAMLKHEDLWLRIKAADALAAIGDAAMPAVPELLELLAQMDKEKDPRGMQQRYLSFALFNRRGGLLGRSLEGVDRELLYRAVRAGLKNDDGRARGSFGSVYQRLSFEEIKPLLPAIHRAVVEPSPSGIMFADGIRKEGLKLLATHRIEEGMQACVDYTRSQNPWASEKRTPEVMKILLEYGAHAKAMCPELEEIAAGFASGEKGFPRRLSRDKTAVIRKTIQAIEASDYWPELVRLK
ncbi:HEAT repeat domain-containing protein [bacterium]|nr:HEAT repeat domain-containing protein [bacterium]MDF1788125.1 DUF6288 domain-containing protein [Verrucomicrobiales bacterium]